MIILYEPYGQHANQFYQHAFLYAYCKRKKRILIDCNLRFFSGLFPASRCSLLYFLLHFFLRVLKKLHFFQLVFLDANCSAAENEALLDGKKIAVVGGWGVSSGKEVRGLRQELIPSMMLYRKHYVHNSYYKTLLANRMLDVKNIGIHIRRGDYATWKDGIFFFSDQEYLRLIQSVRGLIPGEKHFFIFSNEEISIAGEDITAVEGQPWYMDMFLLGQCDYTAGPPSTFRAWASFIYGSRTRSISRGKLCPQSLADFSIEYPIHKTGDLSQMPY